MTVLLTGGFGRTASRIATRLHRQGVETLIASRKGHAGVPAPHTGVTFDWTDASTYENPWKGHSNIKAVYLVLLATIPNIHKTAETFIDFARAKGVERFVLLSGSPVEPGAPGPGMPHAYLAGLGVEYAVLRPSWFFENFLTSISPDGIISNPGGDGKVGFISGDDIADAAVDALTGPAANLNTNQIIVGPELLSHAEIAEKLTKGLGKAVKFQNMSVEEYTARLVSFGLPAGFAGFLSQMVGDGANGAEEERYRRPGNYIGKVKFSEFVEANKEALLKNLK